MKAGGDVVLLRFPFSDQTQGKLRPAMLLAKVPGPHDAGWSA